MSERTRGPTMNELIATITDRVGAEFDRRYGERIGSLVNELAEIKGNRITHVLLMWCPGEWDNRKILYEGTESGCRNHLKHIRHRPGPLANSVEWHHAHVEIRPISLVPVLDRKVDGPEPAAFDSSEWSRQLREKQETERERERNEVVLDTSMWDD